MSKFGEAFKAARKAQGAGGVFEFGGKKYNTNFKEEVAAKNSKNTMPNSTPKADMSNSKVAAAPTPMPGLGRSAPYKDAPSYRKPAAKAASKPAAKPVANWPKGGSPAPGLGRGMPYRDAK
jgi:hypothetical protein